MKKLFTLGLASFALYSSVANAQTLVDTQAKNLVTITGNLDAAYSVDMSPADRAALAEGIQGINNMTPITVDVNSIYSEKDKPAFEAASKEVSRVLVEAAKKLVDMRAIVYKLDISLQQDKEGRFTQNIYNAYNQKFQSSFTALLQLFLGTDSSFNTSITNAMEACFTTSCLQDIANAQFDLVEFGKSINTRIDLNSSKQWAYKNTGFKSRLVKDAVRFTIDEVLKTNTEQNAYVQMLRVAAAPFAAAAAGTSQAFDNLSGFIHTQKASRYLIAANPISKKSKQWVSAKESFENRVGQNYELIVANNNGAKQYLSITPISSGNSANIEERKIELSANVEQRKKELEAQIAQQKLLKEQFLAEQKRKTDAKTIIDVQQFEPLIKQDAPAAKVCSTLKGFTPDAKHRSGIKYGFQACQIHETRPGKFQVWNIISGFNVTYDDKGDGSEFESVVCVAPERCSPESTFDAGVN